VYKIKKTVKKEVPKDENGESGDVEVKDV